MMAKLDKAEVRHILRQGRKSRSTGKTAEVAGVSARRIRRLCAGYRNVGPKDVAYHIRMGWPRSGMPRLREHSAALPVRRTAHRGAAGWRERRNRLPACVYTIISFHDIPKGGTWHAANPRKAGDVGGGTTSARVPTRRGTPTASSSTTAGGSCITMTTPRAS